MQIYRHMCVHTVEYAIALSLDIDGIRSWCWFIWMLCNLDLSKASQKKKDEAIAEAKEKLEKVWVDTQKASKVSTKVLQTALVFIIW